MSAAFDIDVEPEKHGVVSGDGCYTIYDHGVEVWSGSGLEAVQLLASLIRGPMAPRKISLDDELEEKPPTTLRTSPGARWPEEVTTYLTNRMARTNPREKISKTGDS